MRDAGTALMGIGSANGENRAAEAAKIAISSPLLEESVDGATGILLNITGGPDLGLFEVNEAAEIVQAAADSDSNIIFGAVIDDAMAEDVRVTVIATGFDHGGIRRGSSRGAQTRSRDVTIDDVRRSSLEIRDERDRHPLVPEGLTVRRRPSVQSSASGSLTATSALLICSSFVRPTADTERRLRASRLWIALACALVVGGAWARSAAAQQPLAAPPHVIDGPSASIVRPAGIAMSVARDGTGGLVYLKQVAGTQHVFVSALTGGSFQTPVQVDPGLGASSQPVIAAGNGGVLLIAFVSGGELYVVDRPAPPPGSPPPPASRPAPSNPAISITNFSKAYLAFAAGGAVRGRLLQPRRVVRGADPVQHLLRRRRRDRQRASGRRRRRRRGRDRRLGRGRPHLHPADLGDVGERRHRAGRRRAPRLLGAVGRRTGGWLRGQLVVRRRRVPRGPQLRLTRTAAFARADQSAGRVAIPRRHRRRRLGRVRAAPTTRESRWASTDTGGSPPRGRPPTR